MKNIAFKFYTIILFLFTCPLFAQIGDNNTDGTLENGDPPAAPIDECLWILMLAGILFALFKVSKAARQQKNIEPAVLKKRVALDFVSKAKTFKH